MPTISEAFAIAIQHHQAGRLEAAESNYRQILVDDPHHAGAWHHLGIIAHQLGNDAAAVENIRQAIQLNANVPEFHSNLGNAVKVLGRLDEAIACYRRALELNPDFADAHNNLGNALKDQGKFDEAVACYRRALELKPNYIEPHNNLGMAMKEQGRLDEAIAWFRRALELKPDYTTAHDNLLYAQIFSPGCDARAIHEEHCRWSRQHAETLTNSIQPHLNDRSPGRRLRVGYVSPDFRDHVVGRNLLPLFREHDHQNFEIICYADAPRPDELTRLFRGQADAWCDTAGMSDAQMADRIREDRVDILVDLTLHMAGNRLLVFARKPAPVQVTFAGYPGTTGLKSIDYRLTDPHLDPPGLFDQFYTEESVRLPDSFWCYDPVDREPAVNALPAAEKGYVSFGCLNNFCKVNPHLLKIWARVLRAVDRSRLTILAGEGTHRQRTLDLLAQDGVTSDRVTFVANQPRQQYLKEYHDIDIALDTVPYNGHTTSLDALWMGVPVVTPVGPTVVGRAGLCQLMNLGLPELIAAGPEQYVEIATGLARNLPRLRELRATLRDRMLASALTDAPRFARSIEAAYRKMWQQWCAKFIFVWTKPA